MDIKISLVTADAPNITAISLDLVPIIGSIDVITTPKTESLNTTILLALNNISTTGAFLSSFEQVLAPIIGKIGVGFIRNLPIPASELAFLNTELPVFEMLKKLEEIASTYDVSSTALYKSTSEISEVEEQIKKLVYKNLNKELLSIETEYSLTALLKKNNIVNTVSTFSRTVNYRPEYVSQISASDIFDYIRQLNNIRDSFNLIENALIARSNEIMYDNLNTVSYNSLKYLLNTNLELFTTKAGRSHGGAWQGVGPAITPFKTVLSNTIFEDVSIVAKAQLAYELITLSTFNIKKDIKLSFKYPLSFTGFGSGGTYVWGTFSLNDRNDSRVDLRAERRETNWKGVGPKLIDYKNLRQETIETDELVLPARAFLSYSELSLEEDIKKDIKLSFKYPRNFYYYFTDSSYVWDPFSLNERNDSRVDLRAERRETNWKGVGPKFIDYKKLLDNLDLISLALIARVVFVDEVLDVLESDKKDIKLSFSNPLSFIGFGSDDSYVWQPFSLNERNDSRVDLRAERRETNWRGVGPKLIDYKNLRQETIETDELVLAAKVKYVEELVSNIDSIKKSLDIKFTHPLRNPYRYGENFEFYIWTLDNTSDRQESRIHLRAERRELNWGGVGLKMSVPIRLPEQSIEVDEFIIPTKANYSEEAINFIPKEKKDITLKFTSDKERTEQNIAVLLKKSLLLSKPFTLDLSLQDLSTVYRVPLFPEHVVYSFSQHKLKPLFNKKEIIKTTSTLSAKDLSKNINNLINFTEEAFLFRPQDGFSNSILIDAFSYKTESSYKEIINMITTFYRKVSYNKIFNTEAVEVDATLSGFAQDYSPAYFSEAYVGIAFLGE